MSNRVSDLALVCKGSLQNGEFTHLRDLLLLPFALSFNSLWNVAPAETLACKVLYNFDMCRKLSRFFAVALLMASLCGASYGLTLTHVGTYEGNDSTADIQSALGILVGDQIYKADFDDKTNPPSIKESGDFAGNFGATFSNLKEPPKDPLLLTISYDGTLPLPLLTYVSLKAGRQVDVWQITGWAGENIVLTSQNNKGISHGSLFGGPGTNVPDGGATAALLGLGFLGLAAISRKRS